MEFSGSIFKMTINNRFNAHRDNFLYIFADESITQFYFIFLIYAHIKNFLFFYDTAQRCNEEELQSNVRIEELN